MKFSPIIFLIIFLTFSKVTAQETNYYYGIELNSGLSTEDRLPFWLTANDFGKIPDSNYALTTLSLGKTFNADKNFDIAFKTSITGSIADENKAIINELYVSLKYKNLQLNAGSINEEVVFEGLSSSNGNFVKSTNARAIPGINIKTRGYLELPFAKKWLTFKANYGEYLMNDHRFVDNTHIHQKSLHFKSKLNNKLDLVVGLDHYVQWGGTSYSSGKQPTSFKDYIRFVTGMGGGLDASGNTFKNTLGNHIGNYLLQLDYKGAKTNWNFYISHPFEDKSGREWANYPDGLFGVFMDFKKPKNVFSHLLVEYTNTKHMSGLNGPDDADAGRGRDNYFNNGPTYHSGWTYFGQVIGTPFILPNEINEQGFVLGVNNNYQRLKSFHVGTKGIVKNIPYQLKLSYTTYYPWFDSASTYKPTVFSSFLETDFSSLFNHKIKFNIGTVIDAGNTIKTNYGGYIKISKKGLF
ncbi:capsule assembly Wzi family protein [Lutibacter sp. TH_r2]|uniref:capsule assembly Wzi family protein n=1 Tax=Lutibacter sp. TH_r2 TaxID=3082083 RepID=UPI00295393FE|nr:capsule assembly Wzi family protein [Lutibacter sp. TH_r2]MDV7187778.1 capsule assembly Wzi family protein [Lutibacter sp. TH_r2]